MALPKRFRTSSAEAPPGSGAEVANGAPNSGARGIDGDAYRCVLAAMPQRVPDQIREHLAEPVGIPLAVRIAAVLRLDDALGIRGRNSSTTRAQIAWRSADSLAIGMPPPARARVKSNTSHIIRAMRPALARMRSTVEARAGGSAASAASNSAPMVTAFSGFLEIVTEDADEQLAKPVAVVALDAEGDLIGNRR